MTGYAIIDPSGEVIADLDCIHDALAAGRAMASGKRVLRVVRAADGMIVAICGRGDMSSNMRAANKANTAKGSPHNDKRGDRVIAVCHHTGKPHSWTTDSRGEWYCTECKVLGYANLARWHMRIKARVCVVCERPATMLGYLGSRGAEGLCADCCEINSKGVA